MADAGAPPFRWVFDKHPERRSYARRYWLRDSVVGPLNIALHFGFKALPIAAVSAIGASLGLLAKYRYPDSTARARKAWTTLRPDAADEKSTGAAMDRLWRNVGRTMAEFSVLPRLWRAGRISVSGREHLAAATQSGRPVILAALHLGNWETIYAAVIELGFPLAVIYMPPDNRFDHALANRTRARIGLECIKPDRRAAREAIQCLTEKKKSLILYVDEKARGRVWAPAFGRTLSKGGNLGYALRIARLTDALVLPAYSVRLGESARFAVTIMPPLKLRDSGDAEADLMADVAALDAIIDPIVRAHLDQWFFALDLELNGNAA